MTTKQTIKEYKKIYKQLDNASKSIPDNKVFKHYQRTETIDTVKLYKNLFNEDL